MEICNETPFYSTCSHAHQLTLIYSLDLRIGDKYKLIKKVGSGAFGEIFKGNQNTQIIT